MRSLLKNIVMPLTVVFATLTLGSCKKYLDRSPLADIEATDPYQNFRNFQGFTEELYNCIPMYIGIEFHSSWNFGEDEVFAEGEDRVMAFSIDRGNYRVWDTGQYSIFNAVDTYNPSNNSAREKGKIWRASWYGIRKANVGLANLDKLTDATKEEKDLIAGQLYFFRAYFHFVVMQYWGGLPYIDQVLPTDQVLKLSRLSYQKTADKVAEDMRKAADLLPVDWDATAAGTVTKGNNNQRINKITALTFLGKNYLYAGSPLMNRESTGNSTYNTEYCKKAADTFAEALNLVESTKRYELAPFSQYREVFQTWNAGNRLPGLKETILYENLTSAGTNRWSGNMVNNYRPNTINNGGIKVMPTANYVGYYGMANGLPIKETDKADPESGYDPRFPWRGRDPRFYNDVMFDGEKAVLNPASVGGNLQRQYASLFTGGLYRTDGGARRFYTGFMQSKWNWKLQNDYDGYRTNNVVVMSLMRLADVYLMYAEAAATGYGTPQSKAPAYSLSAVDAFNKIRDRAGAGRIAAKFTGSTSEFLKEIIRERAVELSWEGHRFNDLRRWLLLTQRPYTLKTSAEFDRAIPEAQVYADPVNARVNNYREVVIIERQLQDRHYWFPFRQTDVNLYPEFKQNPGW
jgi:hypothetical protein